MIKAIPGKTWFLILILAILIMVIYSQTISFGILNNYDDDAYFTDPRISHLNLANVKAQFSDYYLGMYQPLPVLSFSALLHFFPGSVPAQRIANILLHILNTILVLIFIKRLTGNKNVAFFTALLFAVHPMHVESVSWIATRSNLMYTAFFLLALISYLNWQDHNNARYWILMFLFFLLALFSKVTAATFPLLLPLLDWYKGKKFSLKTLSLYLPLVFLSVLFIITGVHASGAFGHITDLGQQYSLIDRIFIFFSALWLYIFKAFVPVNLSAVYLYPLKQGDSLPVIYFVTGLVAMITTTIILVLGWKLRKTEKGKYLLFGFLFFLLTLLIVMPLKWSRTVFIAERYTYMPYIGLFAGMLLLVYHYLQDKQAWIKHIFLSSFFVLMLLFSFLSFQRNKAWENPLTLFTDVIQKDRSAAEVSVGYFNRGNEYLRIQKTDNALSDYNTAIGLFHDFTDAYYNRGLIYYNTGDNNAAIGDFTSAIRLKPDYLPAYLNRGTIYRSQGNYDAALADFNYIISRKQDGAAYFSRGSLYYFNLNNINQACSDWNTALKLGFEQARVALEKFCGQTFQQ